MNIVELFISTALGCIALGFLVGFKLGASQVEMEERWWNRQMKLIRDRKQKEKQVARMANLPRRNRNTHLPNH